MAKTFSAIDIGSFSIKVVIAELDSSNRLEILASTEEKINGGVKDGQIINVIEVAKSIKIAIGKVEMNAGKDIQELIVSVSSATIQSYNSSAKINIPEKKNDKREVSEEDITRAIQSAQNVAPETETKEVLHILPQYFGADNDLTTNDPKGMLTSQLSVNIHIVSVDRKMLESIKNTLSRIDCNVSHFILQSIGAAEAVTDRDEKELGCLVIDVGESITDYIVFYEGGVLSTGNIPLGGRHITNDLAKILGLTLGKAAKFKETYGTILDNLEDEYIEIQNTLKQNTKINTQLVVDTIEARVEEIFYMIKEKLLNNSHIKSKLNNLNIIITGGTTQLKNIEKVAGEIFNSNVRIGHPIDVVGRVEEIDNPTYSTAIGLIKYSCQSVKQDKNEKTKKKDKGFLNKIKDFLN